MRKIKFIFTISFLLLSFSLPNYSQQDTTAIKTLRIELKDGSILIGNIVFENDNSIQFKTISKVEFTIKKEQIETKKIVSGKFVEGKLWNDDPNSTRLLFSPTGRALKAGHGYFSAYQIFFPFLAVGVTDFLTISGGVSLLPGADGQVLYIAPKLTPYQTEKVSVSGGVLYINFPGDDHTGGIVYGISTFEFDKAAITTGFGYGFFGGDFADNPMLVLGAEIRLSQKFKLISENWIFIGGETQLFSLAFRFFGENLAADFGLILPTSMDANGFPFIPWLGFAYNF
ncbi:MAG: hypothetical protein GY936_12110 [Ignavibacteriae bacterium]|nr:hypothetical protein [Ignavibacteriota bacterium]